MDNEIRKPVKIGDIAEKAGVSSATVSRYFNNGYISQKARDAISKVIEETGYVPSQQARNLRMKKTMLIGVIIPKIDSEAVSREVDGITTMLATSGYETLLANTSNDPQKEIDYLNIFNNNNNVDGIIFIATLITEKHKEVLKELHVPLVMVGQKSKLVSCVYHDDQLAAAALTKKLIAAKRKKIGFIGVTKDDAAAGLARFKGFTGELKKAGIPVREELMMEGAFTLESGYENAGRLLEIEPEIDAIFCATDMIAAGAMKRLHEAGKKIPEEVSITGIGDTKVSKVLTPSLTTAHYYYRNCGMEAAKILLDKLKDEYSPLKSVKMGYEIVENGSV
jgi:LacI family sucrose operon transcriptional repressor